MSEPSLETHTRLAVIEGQFSHLIQGQATVDKRLENIETLLSRVVVVEERISTSNETTRRAFAAIEDLEETVNDLRLKTARQIGWMAGAVGVGGFLVIVIGWVIKTNFDPLLQLPSQIQREGMRNEEQYHQLDRIDQRLQSLEHANANR